MSIRLTIKSTVISLVLFIILLLGCGGFVYFNLLSQGLANIILFIGFILSSLLGAYLSARVCEEKLLLNALLVGVFLSLVIFTVAVIINNSPALHPKTLLLIGGVFAASFIGAILGNK